MTGHGTSDPAPLRRRSLLKGGLALGATAGLASATGSCAYFPSDPPARVKLPASAKAEIDGDLVYFNWADYLAPSTFKGFEKEYGVKVIESNFDSMEGMYAKLQAGNQYDIIFPIAKWVQKLRNEGKIRAIDHAQLSNADQVFYSGSYYNDPWYDAKSAVSVPFTVYKTGIGWRTDHVDSMTGSWNDLWNPQASKRIFTLDDQDEAIAMAALLLGYDVNTAKQGELDEITQLLISQKKYLRAAWAAKLVAAYDRPFWRDRGQNALSESEGVLGSTWPQQEGVLSALVPPERYAAFASGDPETRTREALEQVAAMFGDEALSPLGTWTRLWGTDPWTQGYVTNWRPGDVEAVGPLHGTHEPPFYVCGSDQWVAGYMEGAVRTGRAVAYAALHGDDRMRQERP